MLVPVRMAKAKAKDTGLTTFQITLMIAQWSTISIGLIMLLAVMLMRT
jgi:hypothetical protein